MESVYINNGLLTKSTSAILSFFLACESEGEIFFNPLYQRDYIWSDAEAQLLLRQVFKNRPIGTLAIVLNDNSGNDNHPMDYFDHGRYCEVVDGRQRLTTLLKFYNNEFPYVSESGQEVYFKDMRIVDQREFKKTKLPYYELSTNNSQPVSDIQKIEYFYSVNFAGVPQSDEHKQSIKTLMDKLSSDS